MNFSRAWSMGGVARAAHSYEPTREAGFKIRVTYLAMSKRSPGAPRARLRAMRKGGSKALTPRVWLTATILDGVALRAIVERLNSRIGRGVSALVSAAAEIELHHWPAIPRPIARSVHRHTAAPVIKPAPATAVCGIGV
jgi:hypothetical protein